MTAADALANKETVAQARIAFNRNLNATDYEVMDKLLDAIELLLATTDDSTQTMTNKTLTSPTINGGTLTTVRANTPKFNEDVTMTATSTQLNKNKIDTAVYSLGTPILAATNRIVTSTNMKNGDYTIAAQPDVPRNITVTATTVSGADTPGTITIVGTDAADAALTEVIIPAQGSTVAGTKAFKTVTTVTGAGWTINGTNDTIVIGIGNKLGLSVALTATSQMKFAMANTTWVTIVGAADGTIPGTTIDMSSATYDGSKTMRVFVGG